MDISKIDPNFKSVVTKDQDVEWHEITEPEFSLHGVFFDPEKDCYLRMPHAIAETVNEGIPFLNTNTAGGRVRFSTDSPFVAIQAAIPTYWPMRHMPLTGSHGFSLYAERSFTAPMAPAIYELSKAILEGDSAFYYDELRYITPHGDPENGWRATTPDGMRECELAFPLYGGVKKLLVGVKRGSKLRAAKPYQYSKPVIFYGSSITQGGCASHAGNEHAGLVSRWLDSEHLNLGFSGNARAETQMAAYLASLDPSVYVLDYDHNAPNVEHLRDTHYPLYETIRSAHPNTPIVFISRPDFENGHMAAQRRAIIFDTYSKAKANGDQKVWFIDGETLFGEHGRDGCTVDACHPNDLGFYRMATTIYPVLKEALESV